MFDHISTDQTQSYNRHKFYPFWIFFLLVCIPIAKVADLNGWFMGKLREGHVLRKFMYTSRSPWWIGAGRTNSLWGVLSDELIRRQCSRDGIPAVEAVRGCHSASRQSSWTPRYRSPKQLFHEQLLFWGQGVCSNYQVTRTWTVTATDQHFDAGEENPASLYSWKG